MRHGGLLMTVLGGVLALAGLALFLQWASYVPARHAVPAAFAETARVPGYAGVIRYWGDEITPAFSHAITALYEEIKTAKPESLGQSMTERAEFLAISGGGENGAFAAGLLAGWTQRGNRPDFEAVTGVSTGALAAPFVFLGPTHDKELRDIYIENDAADLYVDRGVVGILGNALKDTAPLEALIRRHATDAFLDEIGAQSRLGRRLLIATTNLDAQRPMIWDLTAIAASGAPGRRDLFVKVLLASAAIPGVFPPVRIPVVADDGKTYDELHVDGGVTAEVVFVPPEVRLNEYEEKVFGKQRRRDLYIIRNGKLVPEYEASNDHTLPLAARGVATLVKYQVIANLHVLERFAEQGKSQFFFDATPPTFATTSKRQFDPAYVRALYACGEAVGRAGTWSTKVPLTPVQVPTTPQPTPAPDKVPCGS